MALGMTHTFDAKYVVAAIAGLQINGLADGDAISIAFNSDKWAVKTGITGDKVRARVNDDGAVVTVKMMRGHEFNTIFQSYLDADMVLGKGCFVFSCIDLNSGSSYVSTQAWIKRNPDQAFGGEAGTVDWIIECGNMTAKTEGIPATPAG